MKYFFDTEFIEDGKTIDLISIGIVCEDGRELYCVNRDAKLHLASDWVFKNVMPHLPKYGDAVWMKYGQIREEITKFIVDPYLKPIVEDLGIPYKIEFWAYFADYDWVAFCQIFGKMMDLPSCFPMSCMDLKQLSVMVGSPEHPKQTGTEHNALEDARWNKELYKFLMEKMK